MANYGDVALGLPANWNRNTYTNQAEWMLYTVGHFEGEADVYLTDEPETEHQFMWVDTTPRQGYASDAQMALQRGFKYVKQDEWTKREENLWAWDAEKFLIHAGQKLMARPKAKWLDEQTRREDIQRSVRKESDRDIDEAPIGLIPTDSEGQVVRRRTRKRGI